MFIHRREQFDLFPSGLPGFTRRRQREVQFELDVLPLVAPEIQVLLALLSFGPSATVPGAAYPLLHLSVSECLTSFSDVMT